MFDFSNPPNTDTEVAVVWAFCQGRLTDEQFVELVDEDLAERWTSLASEMDQSDLEETFGQFMLMSIFQRVTSFDPSIDSDDVSTDDDPLGDMFR